MSSLARQREQGTNCVRGTLQLLVAVSLSIGFSLLSVACRRDQPANAESTPGSAAGQVGASSTSGNREPEESLEVSVSNWLGREAFGVYVSGQKVGFQVVDYTIDRSEPAPRLKCLTTSCMRMEVLSEIAEATSTQVEWYSLDGDGPLLRYNSESIEDGQKSVVKAHLNGERFEVERVVAGEIFRSVIDPPKVTLREIRNTELLFSQEPVIGTSWEEWGIDEDAPDFNGKMRNTLVGKELSAGSAHSETLYEIEIDDRGLLVRSLVRSDGTLVRSEGAGFEYRNEPEEIARKLPDEAPDLTELSVIRIDEDLGEMPFELSEVVLRLSGLDGLQIPSSSVQQIERATETEWRVRITRERVDLPPERLEATDRSRYLRSEVGIESDSELVRSRAEMIVGSVSDPLAMACRIRRWVYENLEKEDVVESDSALVILKQRSGDCSEHARLFVALARAVGLPAREVTGLIYCNDGGPAFGWHAWAQVHDGTRWRGIDPAWDLTDLTAGHLLMSTDSDDWSVGNSIGRLKIKVESFVRDEP